MQNVDLELDLRVLMTSLFRLRPLISRTGLVIFFCCLLTPSHLFAKESEQLHPEVSWALTWQLEQSSCERPKNRSFIMRLDARIFEHQLADWYRCSSQRGEYLLGSFNRLKASAQYGLSKSEAESILANMLLAQTSLETLSLESDKLDRSLYRWRYDDMRRWAYGRLY